MLVCKSALPANNIGEVIGSWLCESHYDVITRFSTSVLLNDPVTDKIAYLQEGIIVLVQKLTTDIRLKESIMGLTTIGQ